MKFKIGEIRVLSSERPYGFAGHNERTPEFIQIKVTTEIPDVPGEFTGKTEGNTGYFADGSDGYVYAHNYPHACESMGEPNWSRYVDDDIFKLLSEEDRNKLITPLWWVDVAGYQYPALPVFADKFERKIHFCETHQNLYYEGEECFYCKKIPDFRRTVRMKMIYHSWTGWYNPEDVPTRIAVGDETVNIIESMDLDNPLEKCPVCESLVGNVHKIACVLEECPKCHKLLNTCFCK